MAVVQEFQQRRLAIQAEEAQRKRETEGGDGQREQLAQHTEEQTDVEQEQGEHAQKDTVPHDVFQLPPGAVEAVNNEKPEPGAEAEMETLCNEEPKSAPEVASDSVGNEEPASEPEATSQLHREENTAQRSVQSVESEGAPAEASAASQGGETPEEAAGRREQVKHQIKVLNEHRRRKAANASKKGEEKEPLRTDIAPSGNGGPSEIEIAGRIALVSFKFQRFADAFFNTHYYPSQHAEWVKACTVVGIAVFLGMRKDTIGRWV